jgi:hypothetical protein
MHAEPTQKRRALRACLAACLLWLAALPAWSQGPALTADQVRGTLAAIRDLQAAFGERLGGSGGMPEIAPGHRDYQRAVQIVREHGFPTLEAWSASAQRVMSAYVALQMAGSRPQVDAEARRALAEVENDPDLSPEQKRQMRQVIEQSLASLRTLGSAPPADQAAVRPFVAEIDALGQR